MLDGGMVCAPGGFGPLNSGRVILNRGSLILNNGRAILHGGTSNAENPRWIKGESVFLTPVSIIIRRIFGRMLEDLIPYFPNKLHKQELLTYNKAA